MILNSQESDIQVMGDIKEFKSSIDPKNLEFITTLLSSNLYSAPEKSFIREIVSNAWDAQVEAGTTDIPIIIKIVENKGLYSYNNIGSITIRDFGTGLSPERFNDIYRNIGSSTKRESNDYHGAFGIGHLSGFSCSNTMYITSYYNGTCYEYIGIKDANTIIYTLVSTTSTTEKNGLEVTLKNVYLEKFKSSLKFIEFFPNVFIEINNPYDDSKYINDIKIKKYNNFWVSTEKTRYKILLGNVLYPIDKDILNLSISNPSEKKLLKFLENIESTGIVLKFDIGDLNVTPNRESIIYTKECIKKIINKIKDAQEEINDIISKKSKKDFTNLIQYIDIISQDKGFDFFNDTIDCYKKNLYHIYNNENINITYKGHDISKDISLLKALTNNIKYCFKYAICNSHIYNIKNNIIAYSVSRMLNLNLVEKGAVKILITKEDIKIGKYLKRYLLDFYNYNYIITPVLNLDNIKSFIGYNILSSYDNKENVDFILQEIVNYIYSNGKIVDFNNDADFIKYKEECKKENKLKNKEIDIFKNKEVNIIAYNYSDYKGSKHNFKNLNSAIKYLKEYHRGIVIIDRGDPSYIRDIILKKGFIPILVNKQIKNIFQKYSFNISKDWVLKKDPLLNYYKTVIEVFGESHKIIDKLALLKDIISSNYVEDIKAIIHIYYKYLDSSYHIHAKTVGIIDENLKNRLLKIKKYLDICDDAMNILNASGIDMKYNDIIDKDFKSIIAKIIIKNKGFIVNADIYKYVKRNKLLNILCKK